MVSWLRDYPLEATALALGAGALDPRDHIDEVCDHIEQTDPKISAWLPDGSRRRRLKQEAETLLLRFPDPITRPPLFGIPVGIKDIFHVKGFETRAGSSLPPHLLGGAEGSLVRSLRKAGALFLGKTVTTEFALYTPGPTRNPHDLEHTPGGSSSGSAAAVAAGHCPLSVGSQTFGSVIRPAAYCGVVGFKPTWGRVPTTGVIPISSPLDHVGLFTQDLPGMVRAASTLVPNWTVPTERIRPKLGIPEGAYSDQASPEGAKVFEKDLNRLAENGWNLCRTEIFSEVGELTKLAQDLLAYDLANVHQAWFDAQAEVYSSQLAQLIENGRGVSKLRREEALSRKKSLREDVEKQMNREGIDAWLAPAATGAAPMGLSHTGNYAMSLPWTFLGLPTLTLPTQSSSRGLPLGLQLVAGFGRDEELLTWAQKLPFLRLAKSTEIG